MPELSTKTWIKISIFNLLLVSILGVIMRYKIGFEFPYLDQKHLQLAHFNFAFAGWITQTILVLLVALMKEKLTTKRINRYHIILWIYLLCSYGILVSFLVQGYGLLTILFSTFSVLSILFFTWMFFMDSTLYKNISQAIKWFRAALIFGIISTGGTFVLAYIMLNKHIHQNTYLASLYYFLHFQYNGLFFFACIGLFIGLANRHSIVIKNERTVFNLLFWSCIPAYFLSVLWSHIPVWLYIIVIFAAIAQMAGWLILLKNAFIHIRPMVKFEGLTRFLSWFIAAACTIKFMLQLGSTIPVISKLAFGFRPIVIAYLHLVLLAIISMLLIFYLYSAKMISSSRTSIASIYAFAGAVFLNELVLAVQGIASFSYTVIPYTNESLFIVALGLFLAITWMLSSLFSKAD